MVNTKYILSKIKINNVLYDIIAKTTGDYVTVVYKGAEVPLTAALADIIADISNLPIDSTIDNKISEAIDGLIDGAPETYNTLKEIADYIASHEEVATALNEAIGKKSDKAVVEGIQTSLNTLEEAVNTLKTKVDAMPNITEDNIAAWNNKVDKVEGKVLSSNDFTDEFKTKLEGTEVVTIEEKTAWSAKAENTVATAESNGLMSKEDKTKLDGMKGVRVGEAIPADMKDGEIFIQVITEE